MTDQQNLANAIRALSMDAVQRAGCGHPGMPMGMADIAQVLWTKHLKYNPSNPDWFDRDRFVLSNGHGSMLLYSLLHLTGYDLSIDELKNRLQGRGTETTESLQKRLGKAEAEIAQQDAFDIVIVNDDLDTARQEVIRKVTDFLNS